jgi:hypothetical protein
LIDVNVNDAQYRSSRTLSAMDQFYVMKRLMPLMDTLAEIARSPTRDVEEFAVKIGKGISSLPDEDCAYVFDKCLGDVQTQRDGVWVTIWNRSAKAMQFQDITMPTMVQLVYFVLMDNFAGFIPALPQQVSQDGPPQPSA